MGSDQIGIYFFCAFKLFLSTLPAWGATSGFFNSLKFTDISIHAPRVGSDQMQFPCQLLLTYFYPRSPRGERPDTARLNYEIVKISIHAPRVGSDASIAAAGCHLCGFLSTLPAWGATTFRPDAHMSFRYFYPRSPRGERLFCSSIIFFCSSFLSTLPAWGATMLSLFVSSCFSIFLSTLPAWGATRLSPNIQQP